VQFGSALANEARANAFITIPGLKGMPAKEISARNLANIIQARMGEILDFVTYHLKQVGMDNRALNGGIILTGGGSQLTHLIQLTEYITGLNARIGYPTEHLAPNHIDELRKPMYSTCIGLILKGYSDYENKRKEFENKYKKVIVPDNLKKDGSVPETIAITKKETVDIGRRKGLNSFWDKFKDSIIDLFKEEGDMEIK
jgi:cell division protein FtsA